MESTEKNRFADLDYNDFRRMAQDSSLSSHEKIGFPNEYRNGKETAIFEDILMKLPSLRDSGKVVLDIGPGCAGLPIMLLEMCKKQDHTLLFLDSPEMLQHLPDGERITKIAGFYPDCFPKLEAWRQKVDIILCYSVFHYIFVEANFWKFIDLSIQLLNDGGMMLIGDIPNVSKRKRFFSSNRGIKFHQSYTCSNEIPKVDFVTVENDKIDDAVILGTIMRARTQGCDAYWLPQGDSLPMANRREDILITKP